MLKSIAEEIKKIENKLIVMRRDSHKNYDPERIKEAKNILKSAGFKEGDFFEIAEEDLW